MKKLILLTTSVFMLAVSAYAQNYYYVRKEGVNPTGYVNNQVFATSGNTILLNKTSNDALSAAQTIPFTFNFYGTAVTSYKASDNGYITFNTSGTASVAPGTSLPTAAGPNNAIYAFWKDFELKAAPNANFPVQVFSYNTGSAPNRRHIIQYFGLSAKGGTIAANADVYSFAIVLYEGTSGRFDLIYNGYGSSAATGLIGCENTDGTDAKVVSGTSSNFKVAADYSDAKNIVYQFSYGTQPGIDPALLTQGLGRFYKENQSVNIAGTITNYGGTLINKVQIYYTVNGGAVQTYSMNSINLLPNGENTLPFTHNIPWTSGIAGSLNDIKVWVGNGNNTTDEDSTNNELTAVVLRNKGTSNVTRNVLFEEATGGWCGYCPDGHLIMKDVVDQNGSRVIPVMHHNADLMSTTESDKINTAYAGGYPDGFIDRAVFPANRGSWASEIAARLAVDAPAEVTIAMKNFNPTTRVITFRVKVRFSDYWMGDLRIGAIVTEDNVRGNVNNNNWSQHNYYSKFHSSGGVGGSSHPLYNEKQYMDGYLHQHVTRSMPGGAWGVASVIPNVAEPDVDYTYDFSYTVPAETTVNYVNDNNTPFCSTVDLPGMNYGWNKVPHMNLVGYVSEYDDNNVNNRQVLNAGSQKLWDLANSINNVMNNASVDNVYPNPAKEYTNLKINVASASNVKIEVYNSLGQLISVEHNGMMEAGDNILYINTADYAAGIYTVNVTTETGSSSIKFTVVK